MGAGLIGLEVGVGLMERGLKVTIVEMLPQILPQLLDADMAKLVQEHLQEKGMSILTSKGVEEFLGEDKVTAVMAGGEKIEADLFISAFGVRANTKLAVDAGIPLGETRAIKTNGRMETDVKDVYAVGDCAEAPKPHHPPTHVRTTWHHRGSAGQGCWRKRWRRLLAVHRHLSFRSYKAL